MVIVTVFFALSFIYLLDADTEILHRQDTGPHYTNTPRHDNICGVMAESELALVIVEFIINLTESRTRGECVTRSVIVLVGMRLLFIRFIFIAAAAETRRLAT